MYIGRREAEGGFRSSRDRQEETRQGFEKTWSISTNTMLIALMYSSQNHR